MIEISRAVSSSISSTSAGIVASPGLAGRAPAALAGDELVAVLAERPDEDRLEDAVLADRRRQLVERLLVEDHPRLVRVRLDPIDGDDPDAGRSARRPPD